MVVLPSYVGGALFRGGRNRRDGVDCGVSGSGMSPLTGEPSHSLLVEPLVRSFDGFAPAPVITKLAVFALALVELLRAESPPVPPLIGAVYKLS